MSYRAVGADPAAPETDSAVIARIDQRTAAIAQQQVDDAQNRKISLIIGGAAALFAAIKLGIIAVPHIRRHLAESNPRRRRRRRR